MTGARAVDCEDSRFIRRQDNRSPAWVHTMQHDTATHAGRLFEGSIYELGTALAMRPMPLQFAHLCHCQYSRSTHTRVSIDDVCSHIELSQRRLHVLQLDERDGVDGNERCLPGNEWDLQESRRPSRYQKNPK